MTVAKRKHGIHWRKIKTRIIARDGRFCHWCGVETVAGNGTRRHFLNMTTIDHVKPLSQGGTNEDSNLVVACLGCNNERNGTPLGGVAAYMPYPVEEGHLVDLLWERLA